MLWNMLVEEQIPQIILSFYAVHVMMTFIQVSLKYQTILLSR